jgi:hypothetical protein
VPGTDARRADPNPTLRRAAWLAGFACLGALSRPAPADVFEFVAGGRVEMPARIDGDRVILVAPLGDYAFERRDFRRIEPAPWPADEWPTRLEAARSGDADARHAAALWALDHGLVEEAAALWRESHATNPDHAATARMMRTLDRLATDRPDPDPAAIEPLVPPGFAVERGPHVVLRHRHDPAEARARVALLERIVVAFYLEFARHGLELEPPTSRLPSIWFPDRSDYLAHLDREGAGAFRTTRGYHHPTRGLVATYDARSDDEQRRARESIAVRRDEAARFRERIEAAPPGARIRLGRQGSSGRGLSRDAAVLELARMDRDLDRQELLMDVAWHRLDDGTAVHELVHQLVARSGLAPRHASFPIWLHEGLAMQFESFRGGHWAGLGTSDEHRLADWVRIRPAPPLAPLLRDAGLGGGYRREPYAQAWAWVHHLRTERPDAWIALLDALRLPAPDARPAPARARAALESAFGGSIPEWERAWHASIRRLAARATADPSPG